MIDKKQRIIEDKKYADVAELVYALALGASGAIHESSNLSVCTKFCKDMVEQSLLRVHRGVSVCTVFIELPTLIKDRSALLS